MAFEKGELVLWKEWFEWKKESISLFVRLSYLQLLCLGGRENAMVSY
jgi:hypothetical protein